MSEALGAGKERLGRMQPVPWLLCMTLVLGIVMGGAYLAGRKAKPEPAAQAKPAMEPLVIPTVEASSKDSGRPVLANQPKAAQPVAATVPPKVQTPAAAPAAVATPPAAPAGLAPGVLSDQDAKGLLFLQVGAVDASLGRDFAQKIAEKGFKVRLAAGPDAKVLRILVGPLAAAEVSALQARLQTAGYTSFPRQY